MIKWQGMGGKFYPVWADTAVQIIFWVHHLPTIKSNWPIWERSNICRGGKGPNRSSIAFYMVLRATTVMKAEVKSNFILLQNVIYPEKSRQIFLQEIFSNPMLLFLMMKINTGVPMTNFGKRYWKVILYRVGAPWIFWEMMIKAEGL